MTTIPTENPTENPTAETVNIRLPDGTILRNVPAGTTRAEILERFGGKHGLPARPTGGFKTAADNIASAVMRLPAAQAGATGFQAMSEMAKTGAEMVSDAGRYPIGISGLQTARGIGYILGAPFVGAYTTLREMAKTQPLDLAFRHGLGVAGPGESLFMAIEAPAAVYETMVPQAPLGTTEEVLRGVGLDVASAIPFILAPGMIRGRRSAPVAADYVPPSTVMLPGVEPPKQLPAPRRFFVTPEGAVLDASALTVEPASPATRLAPPRPVVVEKPAPAPVRSAPAEIPVPVPKPPEPVLSEARPVAATAKKGGVENALQRQTERQETQVTAAGPAEPSPAPAPASAPIRNIPIEDNTVLRHALKNIVPQKGTLIYETLPKSYRDKLLSFGDKIVEDYNANKISHEQAMQRVAEIRDMVGGLQKLADVMEAANLETPRITSWQVKHTKQGWVATDGITKKSFKKDRRAAEQFVMGKEAEALETAGAALRRLLESERGSAIAPDEILRRLAEVVRGALNTGATSLQDVYQRVRQYAGEGVTRFAREIERIYRDESGALNLIGAGKEGERKLFTRGIASRSFPEEFRRALRASEERTYEIQSTPKVREAVSRMATDELYALTPEHELYGAGRLELTNRLLHEGRLDDAMAVFEQLAQTGTQAGQFINQLKMLRSASPMSTLAMLNRRLSAMGYDAVSGEHAQRLVALTRQTIEAGQRVAAIESDLVNNIGQLDRAAVRERIAKLDEAIRAYNKATAQERAFVHALTPESVWTTLKSVLRGSLLTLKSQVANIAGNIAFVLPRAMQRTIHAGIDAAVSAATGAPRRQIISPIRGAEAYLKAFAENLGTSWDIMRYGADRVKGEWRSAMHPVEALRELANYVRGRGGVWPTRNGVVPARVLAGRFIEGVLGLPSEPMLRMLEAADTPARAGAQARIAMNMAKLRGLPVNVWEAATRFPHLFFEPDDLRFIKNEAAAAVFQQDSATMRALNNLVVSRGPFFDFVFATQFPYKVTPWNLVKEVVSWQPEVALAQMVYHTARGDSFKAYSAAARMVSGLILMDLAERLYKNGLVSPSYESKDQWAGVRPGSQEVFPPNHFNVTGFKRWLAGGDPRLRRGDATVDITKAGGLVGAAMMIAANRINDVERGRIAESDIRIEMLSRGLGETARFALNQSMLSGAAGLLEMMKAEPRSWDRWLLNQQKWMTSLVLPNTLAQLSRVEREFQRELRDTDKMKQLANVMRDRLGFVGADKDIPLKVDIWGRPVRSTPRGSDPLVYHLIDVFNTQRSGGTGLDRRLYALYRKTGESAVYPGRIDSRWLGVTYELTDEQKLELARMVGRARRKMLEEYYTPQVEYSLNDEERIRYLSRLYEAGTREGKFRFFEKHKGALKERPERLGQRSLGIVP